MCIDTGRVFGRKLTALRWPERETVSVPAIRRYAEPRRPIDVETDLTSQQDHDQLLYFDDDTGKRRIQTRFDSTIRIPAENGLAALELAPTGTDSTS